MGWWYDSYDYVLKILYVFNILDVRGVIGVIEWVCYFGCMCM